MADVKLSHEEVEKRLSGLNGWAVEDGCLIKEFKFKDFTAAMDFMNSLAPVAEKLNHHPDWSNSYNKVVISLTSHSAGGLTDKDFAFAAAADRASQE
jgi:4a-hydroxytetrahydrobiopterin dehydratase